MRSTTKQWKTRFRSDGLERDGSTRAVCHCGPRPATRKERTLRIEHPSYLLVLNAGAPKVGGTFHFGFRVAGAADVDAWIEHLRANGVPVLVEPKQAGRVYVGRIADPGGYEIEICADL